MKKQNKTMLINLFVQEDLSKLHPNFRHRHVPTHFGYYFFYILPKNEIIEKYVLK